MSSAPLPSPTITHVDLPTDISIQQRNKRVYRRTVKDNRRAIQRSLERGSFRHDIQTVGQPCQRAKREIGNPSQVFRGAEGGNTGHQESSGEYWTADEWERKRGRQRSVARACWMRHFPELTERKSRFPRSWRWSDESWTSVVSSRRGRIDLGITQKSCPRNAPATEYRDRDCQGYAEKYEGYAP